MRLLAGLMIWFSAFPTLVMAQSGTPLFPAGEYAITTELKNTFKKANNGEAEAQYDLGYLYYKGEGVPKSEAAAFDWFELSAQQGFAKAQSQLGYMYYNGVGVSKNETESISWFGKSAEQGDAISAKRIALIFSNIEKQKENCTGDVIELKIDKFTFLLDAELIHDEDLVYEILINRSSAYVATENWDLAKKDLEKIISFSKNDPLQIIVLAGIYISDREYKNAIKILEEYNNYSSHKDSDTIAMIASAFFYNEEYYRSIAAAKSSLMLDPANELTKSTLAASYMRLIEQLISKNEMENALLISEEAIESIKEYNFGYKYKGYILFQMKEYEKSIDALKFALRIDPSDSKAHELLEKVIDKFSRK
jgi:TPR repeat protein